MTIEEQHRLDRLIRKAERAGMSVWAYAVHTGNVVDLRLTTIYRAMTDLDFCRSVLARRLGERHLLLRARA